jgi:hypothetical protein
MKSIENQLNNIYDYICNVCPENVYLRSMIDNVIKTYNDEKTNSGSNNEH